MEKFLFSLLMLLAFFLSLDSLTSDDKEIKLSDEIFWLFNEDSLIKKMNISYIKAIIQTLEASKVELLKEGSKALKDLKRARAALEKAEELEKALNRMARIDGGGSAPEPDNKIFDYIERTKHELLKLLRDFYQDDEILEESFK